MVVVREQEPVMQLLRELGSAQTHDAPRPLPA
jgi:hypothetical protein